MTATTDRLLMVQQSILDDRFMITIRHKYCHDVIGLVKGGLSRQPRMWCYCCDEMVNAEDTNITFVEIQTKGDKCN